MPAAKGKTFGLEEQEDPGAEQSSGCPWDVQDAPFGSLEELKSWEEAVFLTHLAGAAQPRAWLEPPCAKQGSKKFLLTLIC